MQFAFLKPQKVYLYTRGLFSAKEKGCRKKEMSLYSAEVHLIQYTKLTGLLYNVLFQSGIGVLY